MTPKSSIFAVYDKPYCLWELKGTERNTEFLKAIDAEYFLYVVDRNFDLLESKEHSFRAATAIRLAYYQVGEMFFSYLGALLQAPYCAYAWLEKCRTPQLRNIVEAISTGVGLKYHRTNIETFSWHRIASGICAYLTRDVSKQAVLSRNFGNAWSRLAREFLDLNNISEYNALKHGNRVSPGGFTLSMKHEEGNSKPAQPEGVNVMAHSKWGSAFYHLERFGGEGRANRSIRSIRQSKNWSVLNTAAATQLLAMSTRNVISTIQICNGSKPSSLKFYLPNNEDFQKPWTDSVGIVDHISIDPVMKDDPRYYSTLEQLKNVFIQDGS